MERREFTPLGQLDSAIALKNSEIHSVGTDARAFTHRAESHASWADDHDSLFGAAPLRGMFSFFMRLRSVDSGTPQIAAAPL